MTRVRFYVGHARGERSVFTSAVTPTEDTHGHLYVCATGPFRTKRAAAFVARSPYFVGSCADAERAARVS